MGLLAATAAFSDPEPEDRADAGPDSLPRDEELERRGALVGEIYVLPGEVFDENDPTENGALYRLANRLHFNTHESAIRSQLLFATGEPYSGRRLRETERNLRGLRYIIEPEVRALRYRNNRVDVVVLTHDVWSLNPGVSFGRRGGANATSIGIDDRNFLGWGKQISLNRETSVDRTSLLLDYRDNNVLGSRWQMGAAYSNNSDGRLQSFSIGKPFFSLDSRWSTLLDLQSDERIDSRYSLGTLYDNYGVRHRAMQIGGGGSTGSEDGWVRRWYAGFRYASDAFQPLSTTLLTPPENRTLAYPYFRLEWLQDDYAEARNRNQIGRTEDLLFGTHASVELGWSAPSFGASRDALMYDFSAHRGFRLNRERALFLDGRLTGRLENGVPRDALAQASTRFYWPWRPDSLFFAALDAAYGRNLDADHLLQLGGDEDRDLRGYPLRYQSGSSRALLTLEQRFFTDWYPLRLFRVGGAVFFDAGRVWGSDATGVESSGVLTDIGLGLRLGSVRSALGNVLHLDVAMPMNATPSMKSVQFSVRTRTSF